MVVMYILISLYKQTFFLQTFFLHTSMYILQKLFSLTRFILPVSKLKKTLNSPNRSKQNCSGQIKTAHITQLYNAEDYYYY